MGDRLAMLRAARAELDAVSGIRVLRSSSAYETAPQGPIPDQGDFLNACLEVETALAAEELLDAVKALEARLGRAAQRTPQGPRPIDIDLLTYGDARYRSERLRLPHPEILERRFVLEPLLELDPGLTLPDGTAAADARERLLDQRVARSGEL